MSEGPQIRLALAALFLAARIINFNGGRREHLVQSAIADADELLKQVPLTAKETEGQHE